MRVIQRVVRVHLRQVMLVYAYVSTVYRPPTRIRYVAGRVRIGLCCNHISNLGVVERRLGVSVCIRVVACIQLQRNDLLQAADSIPDDRRSASGRLIVISDPRIRRAGGGRCRCPEGGGLPTRSSSAGGRRLHTANNPLNGSVHDSASGTRPHADDNQEFVSRN